MNNITNIDLCSSNTSELNSTSPINSNKDNVLNKISIENDTISNTVKPNNTINDFISGLSEIDANI